MGVEVDDADARFLFSGIGMTGKPEITAPGDFVSATEDEWEMAGVQRPAKLLAQFGLRAFQIMPFASHIAAVVNRAFVVPGQIGQRATNHRRPFARAGAAQVAVHAFVAGEAEQYGSLGGAWRQGLHAIMPAQRQRPFLAIDAALP